MATASKTKKSKPNRPHLVTDRPLIEIVVGLGCLLVVFDIPLILIGHLAVGMVVNGILALITLALAVKFNVYKYAAVTAIAWFAIQVVVVVMFKSFDWSNFG